ncbi:MAG: hypothetical protein IPM64_00795 [Phycisphaerales bacterium]|nr:hypothetical protein [Phycisphaerales bacterium]
MATIVSGDRETFAIECTLTYAYERLGARALGMFVVHVGGLCFGVREPLATLLACAFDEVERRLATRGTHLADLSEHPDAAEIAAAFRGACYDMAPADAYLGVPTQRIHESFHSGRIAYLSTVSDEAFDDGSYVLQFDVRDQVRVIAFRLNSEGRIAAETVRDVWLDADTFYGVLQQWRDSFLDTWRAMPKSPGYEPVD